MKQFWIDSCLELSSQKAEFYSGARKIIRRVRLVYKVKPEPLLVMADCGFTKAKMSMLRRNYLVPESITAAKKLWEKRLEQDKYGSVGFTCYGHYVKGDVKEATPRGSKMGPCLQSVTLTLTKRKTSVDVFYRTTELFKKFPADLVFLRDELLSNFDFSEAPVEDIAFHFANVTIHPMYAVTILPHLPDQIRWLETVKRRDKYFYDWLIKWSARYICPEYAHGIQKFSQALRVQKDAMERLKDIPRLREYLRDNHPGYRGDDKTEEEDD